MTDEPRIVKPMLCRSREEPFDDEDWTFEPKLDGERCIAYVTAPDTDPYSGVRLQTRTGKDATARYPEVVEDLRSQSRSMVLDGEIVALDERGVPDFQLLSLRSRLQNPDLIRNRRATVPVYYEVFDILELDGHDLREVPLYGRAANGVGNIRTQTHLRLVHRRRGTGVSLADQERARGGEGIVAKRRDSTYQEGKRSPDWLKIKFTSDEDFVVVGFTEGLGKRAGLFGALVLGERVSGGKLQHVGSVGTGFSDAVLRDLLPRLLKREQPRCPLAAPVIQTWSDKTRWLNPGLIAKISYANRTASSRLRFPVFLGLRDD